MKRIYRSFLLTLALVIGVCSAASAQHTLGFVAGYGMGSARFYPTQEMKGQWGLYSGGLTWRYYGHQRIVGGFGVDLEFLQQGFAFATNASQVDDKKELLYYSRHINSVVLPIVWQPHVYMLNHHLRVYLEAAATFSYNFSSKYRVQQSVGQDPAWESYDFKLPRDNRWGYGLAGGGGVAVLVKRFEINVRVRYYFGFSDIVRNRNRYYDNADDGAENPFYTTPMRSPLDNMTISVGLNYRFNKAGFEAWKPRQKRSKNNEVFKYGL